MTHRPIIWLLNQDDPAPGEGFKTNRYPLLAAALHKHGAAPAYITGSFSHYSFRQRDIAKVRAGGAPYEIVFIPNRDYRPGVSWARMRSQTDYARGFERWALDPARPGPDLIVASTPPIECFRVAADVAAKLGCKFVADIRDPWPDTYVSLSPGPLKPAAWLVSVVSRRSLRRSLRKADAFMAVSETYLRWGRRNGARTDAPSLAVPLATDAGAPVPLDPAVRLPDGFRIAYVGSLGYSFDWEVIRDAVPQITKLCPDLKIIVVGRGNKLPRIEADIARSPRLAQAVTLTGHLPYEQALAVLRASQAGLQALTPGSTATLPNKFFDFIATGLPVINSLTGEASEIVESCRIGLNYRAGDPASLASALIRLRQDAEERLAWAANSTRLGAEYSAEAVYGAAARFLLDMIEPAAPHAVDESQTPGMPA